MQATGVPGVLTRIQVCCTVDHPIEAALERAVLALHAIAAGVVRIAPRHCSNLHLSTAAQKVQAKSTPVFSPMEKFISLDRPLSKSGWTSSRTKLRQYGHLQQGKVAKERQDAL